MSAILNGLKIFLKKNEKKFGGMKNSLYLCTRLKVETQLKSNNDNASLAQLARARDL